MHPGRVARRCPGGDGAWLLVGAGEPGGGRWSTWSSWAEIRRMHFVGGVSIKEMARRMGRDRNTVRRALRSSEPPVYRRTPRPSKLDPFREEIDRLLGEDPKLPGHRIRELIEPLGYRGGKTILDDYLREVRPLFCPPPRTFQHGLSAVRDLPVRSVGAVRANPGRAWPAAPRLGCRRLPGLLARLRRRAGLLHRVRGSALGHRSLSVVVPRP
jgi:hypothetical protein